MIYLLDEVRKLEVRIAKLDTELKAKDERIETELIAKEARMTAKEARIAELEALLARQDKYITLLKNDGERLADRIIRLEAEVERLKVEENALMQSLARVMKTIKAHKEADDE